MKSSQSPSNPSSASAPLTTPPQKPTDEIDVIRAQFAALANERNTLKRSIQNDRTRRIELQQLIKDTRKGIQKIMPKYSEFENEYVSVQSALSNEKEREKTLASRREKLGLEQRTLNENVEVMMLENEDAVKAHNDGLMILFDDFSEQVRRATNPTHPIITH
ncbi:hypothetical protein TL16_g01762 [Triparma laevis f. inornata]|uniref:Uncharacterized protein n=1 Tax=Triparma laevis f. inornata TaxID=1714386 RepID=A0A9W6ZMQ4_9STRA|nr:hypothetical protein TL16_g01762 [Triparma laevis f. inornata]